MVKRPIFLSSEELKNKFKNKLDQFIDIEKVFITEGVCIGNENVIYPNVYIMGNTNIGNKNTIQMGSVIEDVHIGNENLIGVYAFLRKNTKILNNTLVGPYCEVKNSTINNKVIIGNKSFIGDAIIGQNTTIGAGVVTANYNEGACHETTVGPNSLIGSNASLIAPINICNNVIIAAGSTITKDIKKPAKVFARVQKITEKEL